MMQDEMVRKVKKTIVMSHDGSLGFAGSHV